MTRPADLESVSPPWIHLHVPTAEDLKFNPDHVYRATSKGVVARKLRGKKMRKLEGLMSEFGAALQFFDGFGENWHALKECLSYLDEWLAAKRYLLIFTQPELILIDEPDQLKWLRITLEEVGDWWSTPITDNGRYNRPAIPFHSVLMCESQSVPMVLERYGELPLLTTDSTA